MRATLAALAALFMLAGPVGAADPDLIGGRLTAGGSEATLTSQSTIPVKVTVAGSDVEVSPPTFTLDPGETVRMRLDGPATGTVSAHLTALTAAPGRDASSVVLQVGLRPSPAPSVGSWPVLALLGLLAAALTLAVRRWRPWELRVSRRGSL